MQELDVALGKAMQAIVALVEAGQPKRAASVAALPAGRPTNVEGVLHGGQG